MTATIVDWEALADVVVAGLVAGVLVPAVFTLALWAGIRSSDLRRDGHHALAVAVGAFSLLTLAVFAAAVIAGIAVMTHK